MLAFVVLTAFAAGRDVANAASDLDPLAKHLGPEYIELEGRDAQSLVIGNTILKDRGSDGRFQIDGHDAVLRMEGGGPCFRAWLEVSPTEECTNVTPKSEKKCAPYRVFKKASVEASTAPRGAILGYYIPIPMSSTDRGARRAVGARETIVKGNATACPSLLFDDQARAFRPSAEDLAAMAAGSASIPDGFAARMLIGNSVVRPSAEPGCEPSIMYFDPDGRVIERKCWEIASDRSPDKTYADVFRSWKVLSTPFCPPDKQRFCLNALKDHPRAKRMLCIGDPEERDVFTDCDPFKFTLMTVGAGVNSDTIVNVDYEGYDGFPGVLYRGDVGGMAGFPVKR